MPGRANSPDGIYRWVVYHYRGQGVLLPNYVQDIPLVTIEEIVWRPSKFKFESALPIQPGSKLYPSEEFDDSTVW